MKKTVKIEGMMCQMCVKHVKKALEALDPAVEVSLEKNCATCWLFIISACSWERKPRFLRRRTSASTDAASEQF